jgi:hypothetical protein
MSSEILYVALFVATLPAIWALAALLDRFLPDYSRQHSPRDE